MERTRRKDVSAADQARFRRVLRALELREEKKRIKEGLREVGEWLDKDPASQLGRAAKALVLEQIPGRAADAEALARAVLAEGVHDDQTLNSVASVLKGAGPSAAAELLRYLESRAAAAPDNLPLQEQLLFALLRDAPPPRAAAHAVQLHTRHPSDRAFFLMVACAFHAYLADPAASTLQLRLADGWLSRAAAAGRVSTPEQFQLYLQVLQAAGRLDAARAAATAAPAGCWAHERDRLRALLQLAVVAHDQPAQLEHAHALLLLDPSDLAHWLALADALGPAPVAPLAARVQEALAAPATDSRAPLLAAIHVRVRARESGGLAEALAAYWAAHGARPAARFDLAPLLEPASPLAPLLGGLAALPAGGGPLVQAAANEAWLQLAAGGIPSLAPLLPVAPLPLLPSEAPAHGAESSHALQLSTQLAAAAHVLLARYCNSGCAARSELLAALALLELSRAWVPSDPAVRFALLALYLHAGVVAPAAGMLHELEVKSVQLDSLAFVVLRPLLALPHPSAAGEYQSALAKLARDGPRDVAELVAHPLRHGAVSRLTEFAAFRQRVADSLVLHSAPLLSLLHALGACPAPSAAHALLVRDSPPGLPWSATRTAQLRANDDPHVRSLLSPRPAHARMLAPDWDRAALRILSHAPPVLTALLASPAPDASALRALADALAADSGRTARVLVLVAQLAADPTAEAATGHADALTSQLADWAAPLFGRELAGYSLPAPPPAGPSASTLAEARRLLGEEVLWTVLALQVLIPLVPRKFKAPRAALRKLHGAVQTQLTAAATAVQQALAGGGAVAHPPPDAAGLLADPVAGAVWRQVHEQVAASLRTSLALLHKQLTSYAQQLAAVAL